MADFGSNIGQLRRCYKEYDQLKDEENGQLSNKTQSYGATDKEQINLGFDGDDHYEDDPSLSKKGEYEKTGDGVASLSRIKRIVQLFKYTDGVDKMLISFGTLIAIGTGLCFPLMFFLYSDVISGFVYNGMYRQMNLTEVNNTVFDRHKFTPAQVSNVYKFVRDKYTLRLAMLYLASVILAFTQFIVWTIVGARQIYKIRCMYFKAVILQQVSWFDQHKAAEISARFSSDLEMLSTTLGHKTAIAIQWTTTVITALVVALVQSWRLSLATIAVYPLFYLASFLLIMATHRYKDKEVEAYAHAGVIAEEVFTAIRTVSAFNGQDKECLRYNSHLHGASKVIARQGLLNGMGIGCLIFAWFCTGAVGMGYGIYLYQEGTLDPGNIIGIIMVLLMGCGGVVHLVNYSNELSESLNASSNIYPMVDQLPMFASRHEGGKTPVSVTGHLRFKDVSFSYPCRSDIQVLRNVNINIEAGQTVALVGPTGCGKTTIVQLIERFYNVISGQIALDGNNVNDLNVDWLRRNIGLVSQEPALFPSSIADNIKFGNPEATEDDIVKAAKMTEAHEFIVQFPQGYNTFVGDRGCQLSGGQKQRIAIARALVRDPKILLLDEATSALDSENEILVQRAIEKAQEGRTTLIIAHRLATVIGADLILVMDNGTVVERGTHSELMDMDGHYKKLVSSQMNRDVDDIDVTITASDELGIKSLNVIGEEDTNFDFFKHEIEESTEDSTAEKAPMLRLLKMNAPERCYIVFACATVILFGVAQPMFAVGLSEYTRSFLMENSKERSFKLIGILMAFGVGGALLKSIGGASFGKAGALLTTRIRSNVFASLVRQDMTFFDAPQNRVGVLTNRLSADATLVNGASGEKVGNIMENFAVFTSAVVIGFVYSWKMSLVLLACMPVMMMFGILQGRLFGRRGMAVYQEQAVSGGQLLQECIANIRLVCAFSQQTQFQDRFDAVAKSMFRSSNKYIIPIALLVGLSTSAGILIMTITFTYGSYLVQYEQLAFYNLLKVFMSINQAAVNIGRNASMAPDFVKAKKAARRLFSLLDTKPKLDMDANSENILEDYAGEMELTSVEFSYPYRSDIPVLLDVSLHVTPGLKLALVGSSGCGKTTITALLERFYDPSNGRVLADGHDISCLNLKSYRKHLGIVSQEPVLFDCSIADNIKYGDNSRDIPIQEVIEVARTANAHDFITSLPQGYDTNVGPLGSQLSGGEKQRIAIARALMRNPKVLILDEATSALDSKNEEIVQSALDNACEGRTTIIIAHRLSTIRHADKIAVLHNGSVAEMGTHSELVSLQGIYYRLVQRQNGGV